MYNRNFEFLNNPKLKSRLGKIRIEESSKDMSYCMTLSNDCLLMKNDIPFDNLNNSRLTQDMLRTSIKILLI